MKVLVTGANGMLGQDLCPILEDIGCFVIPTDIDTLDITNKLAVKEAMEKIRPNLIIHCAAYTDVEKAETEQEKAILINTFGTENLAYEASKIDATMLYLSTDYVFDGKKDTPYTPTDIPNPINHYGKTKLDGEKVIQKHLKKYYIVRTSWLYGNNGKNFVKTILNKAESKEELKIVDNQIGCPTWTIELIQGILKILNQPYGIYHICSSGKTSWYNFAKEIFKLKNIDKDITPCTSDDYKTLAERPKYSVMDNNGRLRNWDDALKDFIHFYLR